MRRCNGAGRDAWWENRLNQAATAQERTDLLIAKLKADLKKLPEEQREAAHRLAAALLEGVLDEIAIHRAEERLVAC